MHIFNRKQSGLVLILALWALALLTVFAVSMGAQTRQKLIFLSVLEQREELPLIAESGVNLAIAYLKDNLKDAGELLTPEQKMFRYNNEEVFSGLTIGRGICDIRPLDRDEPDAIRYGLSDESAKINLNQANKEELQGLLKEVLDITEAGALPLAEGIVDWRDHGESQLTGFESDSYYDNLEDPYTSKSGRYEILDELLLVRGMTREIFNKIAPYLTIYGEGAVNINTASATVFKALGLEEETVDNILYLRRGPDRQEATEDDYIFISEADLAPQLKQRFDLKWEEIAKINHLIARHMLTAKSFVYEIRSNARLKENGRESTVVSVYDAQADSTKYWREYR